MSKSILEVWDYRLSTAAPLVYRGLPDGVDFANCDEGNWLGVVCDKGDNNEPLEVFDSGVAAMHGDTDEQMPDSIYEFFRSVRDKYSLPNIEELKPWCADIRVADKLRQKATDAYNAVMKGEVT